MAGAPEAWQHTAVWTGSEMIVWGGGTIDAYNPGGARMRPVSLYLKN